MNKCVISKTWFNLRLNRNRCLMHSSEPISIKLFWNETWDATCSCCIRIGKTFQYLSSGLVEEMSGKEKIFALLPFHLTTVKSLYLRITGCDYLKITHRLELVLKRHSRIVKQSLWSLLTTRFFIKYFHSFFIN